MVYDRRALYLREREVRIGKGIHMAIGAGDTTRIGAFEGSFLFSCCYVLLIAAWICSVRGVFLLLNVLSIWLLSSAQSWVQV